MSQQNDVFVTTKMILVGAHANTDPNRLPTLGLLLAAIPVELFHAVLNVTMIGASGSTSYMTLRCAHSVQHISCVSWELLKA